MMKDKIRNHKDRKPFFVTIIILILLVFNLTCTCQPQVPTFQQEVIGYSVKGRDINAYSFGTGPHKIALIGGIHGGYEKNTITLVEKMLNYFEENSKLIPNSVTLTMVPCVNPDGLHKNCRVNENNVDLNRNWDHDWHSKAYYAEGTISPGSGPFSEPESRALKDFLLTKKFVAVVFYHSAAGGIFSGSCGYMSPSSNKLAKQISQATGYPFFEEGFTHYEITGSAVNYLDCHGIAAVDIELTDHVDIELNRNLQGVMAILDLYKK